MTDRGEFLRRAGAGAAGFSLAQLLGPAAALAGDGGGDFPAHPRWKFVFVSHNTLDPLLVATQFGAQDAAALVRAPKAAPLLTGYRGSEPADLDVLADLVLRVAALAEDVPQVRWLVLEPILAGPAGAQAIGARVKVGAPPSQQDSGPRRLRSLEFLRK